MCAGLSVECHCRSEQCFALAFIDVLVAIINFVICFSILICFLCSLVLIVPGFFFSNSFSWFHLDTMEVEISTVSLLYNGFTMGV